MRNILLDPVGGIAGDMFLAAALDAWPEFERPVMQAIRDSGIPHGYELTLGSTEKGGVAALQFECRGRGSIPTGHYDAFRRRLIEAPLDEATRGHALGMLALLGEAEAKVHGVPLARVHFHELADWDTQADLVGAACIIALLGDANWFVRPLPLGGGVIDSAHGRLTVPAPATMVLLEGLPMVDDGIGGERVTPTGAAIVRYLRAKSPNAASLGNLLAAGVGAGMRDWGSIPNVLRLLACGESMSGQDDVLVCEFEIDDQTPEDLAHGLDRLRECTGIHDVTLFQGVGKKGRPVFSVRLLAETDRREDVLDVIFREMTTIGLRWRDERRAVLQRRIVEVESGGRRVRVKLVERPSGQVSGKAESDDVRDAGDALARQALRDAARRAALESDRDAS